VDEKCKSTVEILRKYEKRYENFILGPIFAAAADTIEELLKCCDALERDNDQLCATIEKQKAEKREWETPATWIVEYESENGSDSYGLFSRRYKCPICGDWQTYGKTKNCPNCGKPMAEEAKDCHNCKHQNRDVRKCQPCLDAGCFPLWEGEKNDP